MSGQSRQLEYVPPHSLEAEQAVLGAVLIDYAPGSPTLLRAQEEGLVAEDFYRTAHQIIYKAMAYLSAKGEVVDLVTVPEVLKKTKQLEDVGGTSLIASLASQAVTGANIAHHVRIVKDYAARRRLLLAAQKVIAAVHDETPTEEILPLLEVDVTRNMGSFRPMAEVVKSTVAQVERRYELSKRESTIGGYRTGLDPLDYAIDGITKGKLILIGGRPSMGKSALAGQIALNVSMEVPVAYFSLEMKAEGIVMRNLAARSGVGHFHIRRGELDKEGFRRLNQAGGRIIQDCKLYFDDVTAKAQDIRNAIATAVRKYKVEVVCIDYLQLADNNLRGSKAQNREREVAEISKMLKNMTNSHDIAIIALTQLNRSLETRPDKRPMLSDLRESGSLEQDADVVAFLYREAVYSKNKDDDSAEIIIAKNRDDPTDVLGVTWDKHTMQFKDKSLIGG